MPAENFDRSGVDATAALVASGHAFAVCDARLPDLPLTWVNPAFERLTGYPSAEVIGRNCRLLQGPQTDPAVTARIKAALLAGEPVTETMLNYRRDGSTWWNQVTIAPVRDAGGVLTHFVGVQSNVDDRVQAGAALDAARVAAQRAEAQYYESEHEHALALQRSLLPALPTVAGLQLAARYRPASDTAEIGGDWYDVLPLPDGSTGIAVGDVMGHDMRAAGSMGQLRSVIRSYAWEGYGPAEVLDRLNQLVCGLGMAQLATCVYARIEQAHGDSPAILRWSNAGHPPPLLRDPEGHVAALRDPVTPLIGVQVDGIGRRPDAHRAVPPGSTLLLYTDGLVEDRAQDIDVGIDRLRRSFSAVPGSADVDAVADEIMATAQHSDLDDDQCLLVVRVDG